MPIRRIKRTESAELELRIEDDSFIATPNNQQRNSLLNKIMNEFTENLNIADSNAREFVNAKSAQFLEDRSNAELSDVEIMEDWQIPLMKAMAEAVCKEGGDILEIGFGRGVASGFIREQNPRTHTIIECNTTLFPRMEEWRNGDTSIRFVEGKWQDTIGDLGEFDGIFFHTYPLDSEEYMEYVVGRSTFAEHFFEAAAIHLRKDGRFTFMSNEIDSLSRAQQIALFRHFRRIETEIVELELNENVRDSWWSDQMVVVKAVK